MEESATPEISVPAHYLNIGWRDGKEPSPFFSGADFDDGVLRIRITNACNAKCRYCGVRLSFGAEVNHAMEPAWYYEICRPLYEKINVVLITGGDAFFAKESFNYMKFLSENFPKITVMTESNGIAFNEKFQTLACDNLFKTHFSINASNADVFAKITGATRFGGRMDFCGWFETTLNLKNFIKDSKVDWAEILNSFEYVAARYRILHGDFRGCQTCCPLNSVKSPIESVTKYTVDRWHENFLP